MLAKLLLFPLIAPIKGFATVADTIAEQVDHELFDKTRITKELAEFQTRLDLGQISEAEYSEREEELLEELDYIESLASADEEEEG